MSLTEFLRKNSDVRKEFDKYGPPEPFLLANAAALSSTNTVRPEYTNHKYDLVGTAADYLIRFYLERLNGSKTVKRSWVARHGGASKERRMLAITLYEMAERNYNKYSETGQVTDDLFDGCIWLAQLDFITREGTDLMSKEVPASYREDLRSIYDVLLRSGSCMRAENICVLNPTFGNGSWLVGGADADVIVDDTLIEFKTTIEPARKDRQKEALRQLLGYYVLSEIGGVPVKEIVEDIKIMNIGVYYSRQGVLVKMPLREIINPKMPNFIKWFEQRALNHNQNA
jgi:hypothetical protein